MTERGAASLMTNGFTSVNLGNPLEAVESVVNLVTDTLFGLPLEVLQLFDGLIPDVLEGAFDTVSGAIGAITGFIQGMGPLLSSVFQSFIELSYNVLSSAFNQIMDIVQGLIVTPINGAVAGFKDWFTGLMGGTIPDLGTAVAAAVSAADGAVADLAALISGLLSSPGSFLGNIPQTLVTGLDGALDDLTDGLGDITGIINDVINAIVSAFRKIPFVGGLVGGLAAIGDAVNDQQVNQQNAIITVAATSAYKNPAWVCRYPIADVSYPETLNQDLGVQGVTNAQSAGTAHTHVIDSNTVRAAPASWSIAQNQARGSVITASSSVAYDTLGITMIKASGATPDSVIPEVFRQDASGGMVKVATLSNIAASIGTTAAYIELALSPPLIAQPGEKFMVLVSNRSSTAQTVFQMGLNQSTYLDISGRLFTSGASVSSFTPSQMTAAINARLPWAMLASKASAPNDQSYSDDFNRTTLGSLWSPSDVLTITNNRAAYKGTTNGLEHAMYIRSVSGDQMLAEANVYNRSLSARLGVMSCCNREFTQIVYLGVNATTANIYTGAWNSLTQRASVSTVSTSVGDAKFGLYNDPSTAKFTILMDGTDIGSWTDTGGVVQLGYDYRFGGIRIERAAGVNAGALDNFTLRDYAP
jgi:hypothetical protein